MMGTPAFSTVLWLDIVFFYGDTFFKRTPAPVRNIVLFGIFRRVLVRDRNRALSLSRESAKLFRSQRRRQNFIEVRNEILLPR